MFLHDRGLPLLREAGLDQSFLVAEDAGQTAAAAVQLLPPCHDCPLHLRCHLLHGLDTLAPRQCIE